MVHVGGHVFIGGATKRGKDNAGHDSDSEEERRAKVAAFTNKTFSECVEGLEPLPLCVVLPHIYFNLVFTARDINGACELL